MYMLLRDKIPLLGKRKVLINEAPVAELAISHEALKNLESSSENVEEWTHSETVLPVSISDQATLSEDITLSSPPLSDVMSTDVDIELPSFLTEWTKNTDEEVSLEAKNVTGDTENIHPISIEENIKPVDQQMREDETWENLSQQENPNPIEVWENQAEEEFSPHRQNSPLPSEWTVRISETYEEKFPREHISPEWEEQKDVLTSHTPKLPPDKREKISEITHNARTLIARGQIEDARTLIVSGLAIEKNHRDLNLLMASIYEREHAFAKAEYLLKDITTEHPDDIELLNHLAMNLALQHKYDVAYALYEKILGLNGESEDILYTLTHLASELSRTDDVYLYAKNYLKQYPRNPDILWLYSQAQIAQGERKEAVETLIKLKNLTPYNQEIVDLIAKLMTEEELAGNFWSGK